MKIAVISDIHANYSALLNCMDEIKKIGVDKIICLGDIVGYYYEPEKCLDLLLESYTECIKGNHENILLKIVDNPENLKGFVDRYGSGIKHAYEKLNKEQIGFIRSLPEKKSFKFDNHNILIAHGSPWDCNFYVYPNASDSVFKNLEKYNKNYIFLGHTHHQMIKKINATVVANPGSIGQPRDIGNEAKWLIFDTDKNKITFFKTPYDIKNLIKQIKLNDPNKTSLMNFLKK